MKDHIFKMLALLGVGEARIEELKAKYEDAAFTPDIDAIVAEARAEQRSVLENDADFTESIRTAERAKERDQFDRRMKQKFGLKPEQLKDAKGERLKTDAIIDLAYDSVMNGASADVQKLQADLTEANNRIKEFEEKTIPELQAAGARAEKNINIKQKLREMMADKKNFGTLRVKEEAALAQLEFMLATAYDADLDSEGNLVFFEKGKQVKPTNKDKTKVLAPLDIVKAKFDDLDFFEKSNAGATGNTGNPVPVVTVTAEEEKKKSELRAQLPHLAEAEKNAAELKNIRTEGKEKPVQQ